jgi:predicted nucleic acid-binding protein
LYLLDTNVVSEFRLRRPNPGLIEWMSTVAPEELAVSVVFAFEAQFGVSELRKRDAGRAGEIERWLTELLDSQQLALLPFDVAAARIYGEMFATPGLRNFLLPDARSKRPKSGVDLMVAATAIASDATVVTFNIAGFERIHRHFSLPGLFDPRTRKWVVEGKRGSSESSRL